MQPTGSAVPASSPEPTEVRQASLLRRLASLAYEALLLAALLLIATLPFVAITGGQITPITRMALQGYVFFVCGTYFVWFWLHGGQTLPMKTWNLRLAMAGGGPITLRSGLLRYGLAWLGLLGFGIGFWWALVDRERCFLHDRLAGTRLVCTQRPKSKSAAAQAAP